MSKTASGMFEEGGGAYIWNVYKYNVHTVQSSMKKTNDRPSESISISCGNGLFQENSFCYVRESEHQKYSFQIFGTNICSSMTITYCSIVNQNEQRDGSFSFFSQMKSQNNVMLVVLCTEIILFHRGFAFLYHVENAKKFDYFHDCCSDFSLNANCFKGQNKDSCQVKTMTTSFPPSEPLNCKK